MRTPERGDAERTEIDVNFNVNVMTGSNGVLRGASGGYSDTAGADSLLLPHR